MDIEIICVGKLKEKYLKDGINEYTKRISRFAKVSIKELKDEPSTESKSEEAKVLEIEGKRIIEAIKKNNYVIALDIKGEKLSSEQLAEKIETLKIAGVSSVSFIIGGSHGLSEEVRNRADYKLSFSDMTFPHQLMRLILAEQIYRALTIEQGLPYHK